LDEVSHATTDRPFRGALEARIFAIQKKEITGKMIVCFSFIGSYNFSLLRFSPGQKTANYRIDSCP
jgi:hypothetical protein